jgi:hypothetical protein
MTDYRGQIAGAVAATVFRSPTCFSWLGEPPFKLPPWIVRGFDPIEARSLLLMVLQRQLYQDFYCVGSAERPVASTEVSDVEIVRFAQKLNLANRGKGYLESKMWKIKESGKNGIRVTRHGLELLARPEDLLHRQKSIKAGTVTTLRSPQGLFTVSPGFYLATSNRDWPKENKKRTNRFYWNLTPVGAAPFIRAVTSTLNAADVPFRVKVANHSSRFNRCDAGVLYLPMDDCELARSELAKILRAVAPWMKQGIPALTKMLAPGFGWAEDPGDGDSFGMHRCHLVAEGLLRAREMGKKATEVRVEAVEACFREAGISLERPFLNPGSRAGHAFDCFCEHTIPFSRSSRTSSASTSDDRLFRETAHRIGTRIVAEALWHGDRCNWLGAEPLSFEADKTPPGRIYKTLGPDLYSGTGGVGMFLAELHAAAGDARARRTAIGAIRHSLSCVETIPPGSGLALGEGLIGIALAAARIGIATDEEEFVDRPSLLLRDMLGKLRTRDDGDSLSGKAGAIVGLLVLWSILRERQLLEAAVQLGEELLHGAEKPKHRILQNSIASRGGSNPTRFAGGASGVAHALLELFRVTGDVGYRKRAEQVLVYENKRLETEKHASHTESSSDDGSLGIALARIRAFEILSDSNYKAQAMPRIRAARQTLADWRRVRRGDFSMAKGVAGNAELILHASEVLGGGLDDESALALRVAREAGMHCAVVGYNGQWGATAGETPSLMSGLAGIGYFYLRLRDPSILSTLTWIQRARGSNALTTDHRFSRPSRLAQTASHLSHLVNGLK